MEALMSAHDATRRGFAISDSCRASILVQPDLTGTWTKPSSTSLPPLGALRPPSLRCEVDVNVVRHVAMSKRTPGAGHMP